MEARSVYEDERKRRNSFENILNSQKSQLRRDLTSIHATALLHHLEQALAENVDLLNEILSRLRDVQEKLARLQPGFSAAEILPLTAAVLAQGLPDEPTKDPIDNLILAVIREHALQHPDEDKAFLRDCIKTRNRRLKPQQQGHKTGLRRFRIWFQSAQAEALLG